MASDHSEESAATADDVHSPSRAPAPLWKAAAGWLLLLLVVGGLIALFWPRIRPLVRHDAPSVMPAGTNGAASAGANGAGAMPLAAPFHPKPTPKVYPPCTATRTDSCIETGTK